MSASLINTRPQTSAAPTWQCVVAVDQCYRKKAALCGSSEWERLPDDEAETVIWGSGTKVGPVGAI